MTVPLPQPPGAEMSALLRFHRDTTWTGTIRAGGHGRHEVIQDGRWIVGTSPRTGT